jgi:hypothetical protein
VIDDDVRDLHDAHVRQRVGADTPEHRHPRRDTADERQHDARLVAGDHLEQPVLDVVHGDRVDGSLGAATHLPQFPPQLDQDRDVRRGGDPRQGGGTRHEHSSRHDVLGAAWVGRRGLSMMHASPRACPLSRQVHPP